MDARTWLLPVGLAGVNLDPQALVRIAILDFENVAIEDNGDSLVWIAMPGHCLPGFQGKAADSGGTVAKEFFILHQVAEAGGTSQAANITSPGLAKPA